MDATGEIRQKEFLGREFLTWLWFRSEAGGGDFELPGGRSLRLSTAGRLVLASDPEEHASTVVWTGEADAQREARVALAEGKKLVEARFEIEMEGDRWLFTLDAAWLNLKSVRTPKVERDGREDAAGALLEKVHRVRMLEDAVDGLAELFLKRRVTAAWSAEELPALRKWVRRGD